MYNFQKIPVSIIEKWKQNPSEKIEGFYLPNVKIPNNMNQKSVEAFKEENIKTAIRNALNSLNVDNIESIKKSIKDIIFIQVKDSDDLRKIVEEFYDNIIIISIKNISLIINIIDSFSHMCIEEPDDKYVFIGNVFLELCKKNFFSLFSFEETYILGSLDCNDQEDADIFYRKYDKNINIINLLVELNNTHYKIKINNDNFETTISFLFELYEDTNQIIKSLKNPYESDDITQEQEIIYLNHEKTLNLYIKYILTFLQAMTKHKINFIEKFKSKILPNITDQFLIDTFENIIN